MYVVAIAELASSMEAEAMALASDLDVSRYDARMLLAAGLPAVVRTTADKDVALDLLARLRGRGHGAVACDAAAVVSASAMVSMRHVRFGEHALTLGDQPGLELRYDDIVALVAAAHRTRVDTETHVRQKKVSVSRAILTSGLSITKTVGTDTHAAIEERETVLYVFPRPGATSRAVPWLLREHGAEWTGLGRPPAPTRAENFRLATELLRTRAKHGVFDDRLVGRRARESASLRSGSGTMSFTTSSEEGTDLLAHLVALWTARSTAPAT